MGFSSLGSKLQKENFSKIRHKREIFQKYSELVNKSKGFIGYKGKRHSGYKSLLDRISIWVLSKLGISSF